MHALLRQLQVSAAGEYSLVELLKDVLLRHLQAMITVLQGHILHCSNGRAILEKGDSLKGYRLFCC